MTENPFDLDDLLEAFEATDDPAPVVAETPAEIVRPLYGATRALEDMNYLRKRLRGLGDRHAKARLQRIYEYLQGLAALE